MKQLLTETQKILKRDFLSQRDGLNCLYCKSQIDPNDCDIDHLDNNPRNNENWNLVLSHHKCNCEKRNNTDFDLIAQEKIKLNQSQIFIPQLEDNSPLEASTEIQININSRKIAERFITEQIQIKSSLLYQDVLNSITFLCNEKTGHGSQQSTRNYIDSLTCSVAPFMISKNDEGKKIIKRRTEN